MLYLFISDHDREPTQNTDSFEKQNGEGKCNLFGILLRIEEISNFFLMRFFFFFYKSENCVDIDLSVLLALKKKEKHSIELFLQTRPVCHLVHIRKASN